MSGYKGQRGPNVSQYIANLNQLSPASENLNDPLPTDDDFSAFLNNDFFDVNAPVVDFDSSLDLNVDLAAESSTSPDFGNSSRKHSISTSAPNMDFNLNGDFPFTDFSNNFGPNPILDPSLQGLSQNQPAHYQIPHNFGSPTSALSPTSGFDQAAKKRKLDAVAPVLPHQSLDESARNAAEEDKRRRNTAASARFRVKKKQREATLEKTAKEMSDKATRLEQKVQQLETENAWLKSLITEKSGNPSNDLKKLLSRREEAAASRSSSAHTDGVGTDA